jgi:excisionase family DNA binding protein
MRELTIQQVAKRLGLNPRTIRRWISEGKLRKRAISQRTVMVDPESLIEAFGDRLIRAKFPELFPQESGTGQEK